MVGQIVPSLAVTTPDGYIEVNGQTITRTNYPKFFEVMGIEGDSYTLPNLNTGSITIGGAGTSTFSFRAHENGANGTLAPHTLQQHQHSAPSSFSFPPISTQQGSIGYTGANLSTGNYGPVYNGSSTTQRTMSISVDTQGEFRVRDNCIGVTYLIGVE